MSSAKEVLALFLEDFYHFSTLNLTKFEKKVLITEFAKVLVYSLSLYGYAFYMHKTVSNSEKYPFTTCVAIVHCLALVNSEIKYNIH